MKRLLIVLGWVLLCTTTAAAQDTGAQIAPEKRVLIDRLLEQTGQSAALIGQQYANLFVQQLTMILRETNPDIDQRAYAVMQEEVQSVIQEKFVQNNQLAQMLYPIYDTYFSAQDLQQMIAFNESEIGKKLIEVMPAVTSASMQAGQEYGMMLGPIIQERLAARFAAEGLN